MVLSARKFLLGFVLSLMLLPMMAFASTEFKGTETVNINKANAATLAAYLKGVGPNKAEAIVKYRKSNGSFKSAADIKNVPGIGDETYKDVKSKISTSRGKSTAPKGYKLGETSGKSKSTKKKTRAKKTTGSSTSSSSSSSSTSKKSKSSKSTAKKSKSSGSTSSSSSSTSKKPLTTKQKAAAKKKAAAAKKKAAAAKKKAAAAKKKAAAKAKKAKKDKKKK